MEGMLYLLIHQQLNIISLGVLLLFLIYAFYTMDIHTKLNKVYLASLFLNIILLCIEIVLYQLVNEKGDHVFFINLLGTLICMLAPILAYLFLKLVCLYFPNPYKIKKSTKNLFLMLLAINFISSVFILRSNESITDYELISLILPFFISAIFILYTLFVIYKCKKALILTESVFIIGISIIGNVLIWVQFFLMESRFLFVSSAFIDIMMFIVIQQKELYRDPLTGARNRLVLKKYITKFLKVQNKNLSVVMIDLDYFKNINDTYGHAEGDHVLKVFVKMLQKVISDKGIVIRMGGDEFLILVSDSQSIQLDEMMTRLSRLVDKYNNKGVKPYRIKYSYATGTYANSNKSVEQFIHEIDIQMYVNKKNKRIGNSSKREKLINIDGI